MLTTINPVGAFGPVLGPDYATSISLLKRLMEGMPAVPRIYFGIVDVRDLADLHIRAMTSPKAGGERFIATAGTVLSLLDVAKILRSKLGDDAQSIPRRELPDWPVRLMALVSSSAREIRPQLGIIRASSNKKAQPLLDWRPRAVEETIVDTARSLLKHGLIGTPREK